VKGYSGWRGSTAHNPQPFIPKPKPTPQPKKRKTQMYDGETPISLWCEFGGWENGHPFSSKDPDYQTMRQTRKIQRPTGNSYGITTYQDREEVTDTIIICGRHIQEMTRSFRSDTPNVPEIPQTLDFPDLEPTGKHRK
jgi:hypothetical protein